MGTGASPVGAAGGEAAIIGDRRRGWGIGVSRVGGNRIAAPASFYYFFLRERKSYSFLIWRNRERPSTSRSRP